VIRVFIMPALVALAVAGCGHGSDDPRSIDFRSQTVRLRAGDAVVMTDPSFSPGIGDSWSIVTPPDPHVATIKERLRDCDMPGCTGELDETVSGVGAGETTIVLQYCYRSAPPDCQPRPGESVPPPVTLHVEVS
jgi:hypothetical protein